ncbi:MAG: DUF2007 domain-containing protein [Kangiella sp.]|jgi:hypothetical protein|nr:DUF2007 domain-containing protein [Kangiella sp.]
MKIVYHAENAMDATIIRDLLTSSDIYAQVRGMGMQGAVGEAAAMNNVKVWVHDEDYVQAREIVDGWQAADFTSEDADLFDAEDDYHQEPAPTESHLVRDVCIAVAIVLLFVAATIEF